MKLREIVNRVNDDIYNYYQNGGNHFMIANTFVLDAINKYPVFAKAYIDETIVAGIVTEGPAKGKLCVAIKRDYNE